MRIYNYEANGHHFEFICKDRDTRNGFAHDATLICDGGDWDPLEGTCHYLNRTWERYTYQSVMQKVVGDRARDEVERAKRDYMEARGYERMTAKRRAEFLEHIDNEPDDELKTWTELYELVTNDGLIDPYPEWYCHRPISIKPSYFA